MIKTHAQQMELRLPRIGTIRKGAPKPTTGPGKDLDYFRLDRAAPDVVTAWNAAFGPQPKALSGILPYSDPAENLSIWDELWKGKRMLWRGDGERLHVKLDGNGYVRYAPGNGPAQPAAAGEFVDKLKVARVSRLRLLLPQLGVAGIFEVMSSSAIDADELWANLMWVKSIVATLQGAPVTVFRAERQFNVPKDNGETMIVKKHMLHLMLDGRSLSALLPAPGGKPGLLPPPVAPVALTAGPGQTEADDDDAPEDGEYEDTPPANGKPTAAPTPAPDPLAAAIMALPNSGLVFSGVPGAAKFIASLTADAPRVDDLILIAADKLISARADGASSKDAVAAVMAWYRQGHTAPANGTPPAEADDARDRAIINDVRQDDLFGDGDPAAKQAALDTAAGKLG